MAHNTHNAAIVLFDALQIVIGKQTLSRYIN